MHDSKLHADSGDYTWGGKRLNEHPDHFEPADTSTYAERNDARVAALEERMERIEAAFTALRKNVASLLTVYTEINAAVRDYIEEQKEN